MPLLRKLGFRSAPIRIKLTALMLLTATVALLFALPAFIGYSYTLYKAESIRDLTATARTVAENTTAALTFSDNRAAAETLAAFRAKQTVLSACLYRVEENTRGQLFAVYEADGAPPCAAHGPVEIGERIDAEQSRTIAVAVPATLSGEVVGSLYVMQSLQNVYDAISRQIAFAALILAISFALSFLIAIRAQSTITGPILELAETARRISDTGNYSLRVSESGSDELGRLASDFNGMLLQIATADDEVRRGRHALAEEVDQTTKANAMLEQTLADLRRTQDQLVQSEKMASLGALVAGVAHEINTPVGVGVTAASTLTARVAQIKEQYDRGDLRRTELERFFGVAHESSQIILKNLERAADLIQSFKRVAVDQSSDERRKFDLKTYIADTLLSLAPKYSKLGHSVSVDCPDQLEVDSYPGAIAQILTNFISNSITHAFEPGQAGVMRIQVSQDGGDLVLRYSDNGKGIAASDLGRVFDPFFTTARGAGGSGLGLHIVYNLVAQTLGGTVRASSHPGQGAVFEIRFPRVARSKL